MKSYTFLIRNNDKGEGFSLLELLIVVAIIVTLASIAVPGYVKTIQNAKNIRAMSDIKSIQTEISIYELSKSTLPESLDLLNLSNPMDPWGNPYVYFKIAGSKGSKGKCRKDKFFVPINDDYDLYSNGQDGRSTSPLTAQMSRDDIVRASNGGFIGLAVNY